MSQRQELAIAHLNEFQFDQALAIASELGEEPDTRFQHLRGWSEQLLQDVESQQSQQLERMKVLFSEALRHEAAFDYQAGIHALNQTPDILRETSVPGLSVTVAALLTQLREKQAETQRLDKLIRQRVKSRNLNGLQADVDHLLLLRPDRNDLQKLKDQLVARDAKLVATSGEVYGAAQDLLQAQDYAGVLKELDRIDPSVGLSAALNDGIMQPKIDQLREEVETKRDRLQVLDKTITAAVAENKLHDLLKQVEECLSLRLGDEEMQILREQLIERDKKNAAQIRDIVDKARDLRELCQFEAAICLLTRIPPELRTGEVADLLQELETLAADRSSALDALGSGTYQYNKTPATADEYGRLLATKRLSDEEFSSAYQAWKDRKRASELLPVAIAGVLLLMVIGWSVYSAYAQR